MLFNALVISALATTTLALPHIKRTNEIRTTRAACLGVDCAHTTTVNELSGPTEISTATVTGSIAKETTCVGINCENFDCVGPDCDTMGCQGPDCMLTMECTGPDCISVPCENGDCSLPTNTTTESTQCVGDVCTTTNCVGTHCSSTTCTGSACPSSLSAVINSIATSTIVPLAFTTTEATITSTIESTATATASCIGSDCVTPTCTGTGCGKITCDSTDPALCPTTTCDGTSDASTCGSGTTTSDIPSNHMPGGPHMPTFSHTPLPGDASDLPTCGSANWIMGSPCDCPTGSYQQSSTSVGNWPVPASDLMNVTGDFWSTAWAGEEAADIQGKTGATVGDMRLFSVKLPGASKLALITEKLVKMQRNEDGGYSMMFGFIDMPLTYYEADGSLGQIGSSWDSMDVTSTGSKSSQMTWTTSMCASAHSDLAGNHESAMKNITSIMQEMGALPSMLTPTDITSM